MYLYQTFISVILLENNIPHFTVTPYLSHHFLAVRTFVDNYYEEWSTGREMFHQKSLMNTLLFTSNEQQPLPSNNPDAFVSQKNKVKHPTSFTFLLFSISFCFNNNNNNNNVLLLLCITFIIHFIYGPR